MSNDIETAVAEYLAECGIEYTVKPLGERNRDGWTCDAWIATFATAAYPQTAVDFEYYTGTGHRKPVKGAPADKGRPNTLFREEWEKRYLRPVAPPAAGVLYSVIMDGSASEMSFADWCDDFGCDTDSRKALALAMYEACQIDADKLRKVLNRDQRARLDELLQDY